MSYKIHTSRRAKKWGKPAAIVTGGVFIAILLGTLILTPPAFVQCKGDDSIDCTCPSDKSDIGQRNILLIDTTDPVREGKFGDVERLLDDAAASNISIWSWLAKGKKVEQTAVYLLGAQAPADMQPIATFCARPPEVALVASNLSAQDLKRLEVASKRKVKDALVAVKAESSATSSPIIEALSIITGNSSVWSPGGRLIIVSDMIQNSPSCGWFTNYQTIPPYDQLQKTCEPYVATLVENLRPTKVYPKLSSVAICTLPRPNVKPGLQAFWRNLFQEGLQYDYIATCDPLEIRERHDDLNSRNSLSAGGKK